MSIATLVIGQTGTGKTASLRNINPNDAFLISAINKPLPFRSKEWIKPNPNEPKLPFNHVVTDDSDKIFTFMKKTKKKIIIIDDLSFTMTNEKIRRAYEKGYQVYVDIQVNLRKILDASITLADDVRVYIFSHIEIDEHNNRKFLTVGKMLDKNSPVESFYTIVLGTAVANDKYYFVTQNDGSSTLRSPMGMFSSHMIENDLNEVDKAICDYYGITNKDNES
jgi:hypothetical protein